MKLEMVPGQAVGKLKIGMTRREIRELLKARKKPTEGIRYLSKTPIDYFLNNSLQVSYSNKEICEAIEVAEPNKVTLNGVNMIGKPLAAALALFQKIDKTTRIDNDGIISRKLGIGVYIPGAKKEKRGRVEAVIVFVDGYYKKNLA